MGTGLLAFFRKGSGALGRDSHDRNDLELPWVTVADPRDLAPSLPVEEGSKPGSVSQYSLPRAPVPLILRALPDLAIVGHAFFPLCDILFPGQGRETGGQVSAQQKEVWSGQQHPC